ncbi:molybdopterin molybdotransferase MoeA [Thermovibrio sp.]
MKVKREEAKELILKECKETGTEVVALNQAYGRVIAQEVYSPVDIPETDKSAIDGFAFKSSSIKELPAKLKIVGEVAAGEKKRLKVKEGEAVFVMTGGVIPEGTDTAVRVEDVKVEGKTLIVEFPVKRGELVNFKGSEVKKGEKVLEKGEVLDFRKVGLLANLGIGKVRVYQRVKVGIITTGSEVLEPEEPFKEGAVRNSNFYILKGLLEGIGAEVVYLGKVKDNLEEIKKTIEEGLSNCQIVATTGGVSKGKYDFVKEAAKLAGVDVKFTQTNIRPGRPLLFGKREDKLFFGLPGYPAAMLVNALEFLLPAVRKVSGFKDFSNKYIKAVAGESLKSREGRVDFLRVNLKWEGGKVIVLSAGSQQTSNYLTAALCQALAVIGEERGTVKAGEVVDVLLLS